MAGALTGPGHLGDRHPALGAADPRGISLQVTECHAEIEGSPVPASLSPVITGGTPPAEAAGEVDLRCGDRWPRAGALRSHHYGLVGT